jgi:rSAM/selenodomain-associated transferase 2
VAQLSIIIPTYNEAASIGALLEFLLLHVNASTEIIIADGASTDATCFIAKQQGVTVLHCKRKGRAPQMNEAATKASGNILYFLHADTYPPADFEQQILYAVANGNKSGCFRLKFDEQHWFLQANAWFTRFDIDAIRFGDQSLFVVKEVFQKAGGFNEQLHLLEDQEIITRLKQIGNFAVLADSVVTSARKYKEVGVYKLQAGYFLIFALYKAGFSQERLVQVYKWLLCKEPDPLLA